MSKLPLNVKVIAAFWGLLGLALGVDWLLTPLVGDRHPDWYWLLNPVDWVASLLFFVVFVVGLPALAVGLLRRSRLAWHCAVGVPMIGLLLCVPLAAVTAWGLKEGDRGAVPAGVGILLAAVVLSWQVWSLTRPQTAELYGAEAKDFWGTRRQLGIGLAIYAASLVFAAGLAAVATLI